MLLCFQPVPLYDVDDLWLTVLTFPPCVLPPSPQAFDELLLLKRGGRTIFHGALGSNSAQLIEYFTSSVPAVQPPKNDLNPATWMLDISAVGAEAEYKVDWADIYAHSQLRR